MMMPTVVVLIPILLSFISGSTGANEPRTLSLDHQVGLFPFPRIGRSDRLVFPYENYLNNIKHKLNEISQLSKRREQTLHPADLPQTYKLDRRLVHQPVGLWFGPRLGKKSDPETRTAASASSSDNWKGSSMPINRVGRTIQSSVTGPKRNGASPGGGLWFGPRLGKRGQQYGETTDTQGKDDWRKELSVLIPKGRQGRSSKPTDWKVKNGKRVPEVEFPLFYQDLYQGEESDMKDEDMFPYDYPQ